LPGTHASRAGGRSGLNQWISSAVAQKVGSIETAADFFKQRASHRKGAGLTRFFINAPDVPEVGNETESSRRHLPATAQATVSLSYRDKDGQIKAKRSKSTTLKNTVQKQNGPDA
jgi:hypothetical protein